jgi:hypothetical protein
MDGPDAFLLPTCRGADLCMSVAVLSPVRAEGVEAVAIVADEGARPSSAPLAVTMAELLACELSPWPSVPPSALSADCCVRPRSGKVAGARRDCRGGSPAAKPASGCVDARVGRRPAHGPLQVCTVAP